MSTLNIIKLIDKSSMTRLSKEYENSLITKIKDTFTDSQQQIFVGSFYCFLNYDSKKDFVVDFDNVWKWVGFTRKGDGKRLLEKHFVNETDYQVKIAASQVSEAAFDLQEISKNIDTDFRGKKAASPTSGAAFEIKNLGGSGLNKEQIMLTVNTFKKFCLKAGTKKADEIHDYYIKLEELLQETINEETNELRLQLQNKEEEKKIIENRFIDLSEKHFKLEENHKRILYKKVSTVEIFSIKQ